MNQYEKAAILNGDDSKQIIGVKKETIDAMVEVLKRDYAEKHKYRGRHTKLPIEANSL